MWIHNKHHLFQFSAWIDALLLVFSLESEESFSIVCSFYNRMCSFRNMSEVPKILVGVQGNTYISFIFMKIFLTTLFFLSLQYTLMSLILNDIY